MLKRFFRPAALLAIAWSVFQLYTAGAGFYPEMVQRPLYLVFALSLAFLIYPARRRTRDKEGQTFWGGAAWYDLILSGLSLAGGAHLVWNYERLVTRLHFVDVLQPLDIVSALLLIGLTLEACRRVVGWSLPSLAIFLSALHLPARSVLLVRRRKEPLRALIPWLLRTSTIVGSEIREHVHDLL